jgi:hypothetical protein
MYVEYAFFSLHPIAIVAKRTNADMLQIWLLGKPVLRPERLAIVIFSPCLDKATSQSMYEY